MSRVEIAVEHSARHSSTSVRVCSGLSSWRATRARSRQVLITLGVLLREPDSSGSAAGVELPERLELVVEFKRSRLVGKLAARGEATSTRAGA